MGAESIQRGLGTQKDSNIQIAILIRPTSASFFPALSYSLPWMN